MTRSFLLLFCAAALSFGAGCSEKSGLDDEPTQESIVASFSTSASEVYKGDQVQFTNTSQGAERYEWTFGDGATSTETSPKHSYTSYGRYTIQLSAYKGDKEQKTTKSITVTSRTIEVTTISAVVTNKKYYPSGKLVNGTSYKYEYTLNLKNTYYGYKQASKWGVALGSTYFSWNATSDSESTLQSVKYYLNSSSADVPYMAYAIRPGGSTYGDVFGETKSIRLSY